MFIFIGFIGFIIRCFFISFIVFIIDLFNKNKLKFYDILLFVFVSLFICYNFPSLYVLVITKVRFNL